MSARREEPIVGGAGAPVSIERGRLRRAQAGDSSAFEGLYRQHVGCVYAVVLRMTGNRQVAEEMTQEVFVRAWQKLGTLQSDTHLAAWLRRVAVNLVINERRSWVRKDSRNVAMETLGEQADTVELSEPLLHAALERAIASLPEAARSVFVLHDVHGYKHEEIAKMTGRAVGTSKAQLHRARKKLREVLGR